MTAVTLSQAQIWGLAAMIVGLCALSAIVTAAFITGDWRFRRAARFRAMSGLAGLRRMADPAPVAGDLEADAYPAPELLAPAPGPERLQDASERAAAYAELAPAALDAGAGKTGAPALPPSPPCRIWYGDIKGPVPPGVTYWPALPRTSPAQFAWPAGAPVAVFDGRGELHPLPSPDWHAQPESAGSASCAARYDAAMDAILGRMA